MKPTNIVELPVFIDVHDVMRSMKCSRTMAYGHMRSALGGTAGERGQLRVPLYVWHRYVRSRFDPEGGASPRGTPKPATGEPRSERPIPITRPRTKPQGRVRGPENRG